MAIRRGDPRSKTTRECQCPISSLSGVPATSYRRVAETHGIDDLLTERIAKAADNECLTSTEERIRRALLKRCGLSDPPSTASV